MSQSLPTRRGPFRVDQLRSGDPYELSEGHPILRLPSEGRGSAAVACGASVLGSDPLVQEAGVDTGFALAPDTLRAPDIAVGNLLDEAGWVAGAPLLAVEYADTGRDDDGLARKIHELITAGTRLVWVVRLAPPRRVEVHEAGLETRLAWPGEELTAPGILTNRVPVEALYDPEASQEATFRNLLHRHGYDNLEAVRRDGVAEILRKAIVDVLAGRGLPAGDDVRSAIAACRDTALLERWLTQAATAATAEDLLAARAS